MRFLFIIVNGFVEIIFNQKGPEGPYTTVCEKNEVVKKGTV